MSWLLLIAAIFMEVCGTTCMKLSQGFTKIVPKESGKEAMCYKEINTRRYLN